MNEKIERVCTQGEVMNKSKEENIKEWVFKTLEGEELKKSKELLNIVRIKFESSTREIQEKIFKDVLAYKNAGITDYSKYIKYLSLINFKNLETEYGNNIEKEII